MLAQAVVLLEEEGASFSVPQAIYIAEVEEVACWLV